MFETEKQRKWFFGNHKDKPVFKVGNKQNKPRPRERIEKFAPEIVVDVMERFPDKQPKKIKMKFDGLENE